MNLDYLYLNISGFIFYSIYCLYGYFTTDISIGKVNIADVLFALHALAICLFQYGQSLIYPKGNNKLSK
jgi:hypothetical protein